MSESKSVTQEAFAERFHYLRSQPDGFYHGEGKAFQPEDLDRLKTWLEALVERHAISFPWLYPLVETAVAVEWEPENWDVSLVIDFVNRSFDFYAWNDLTKQEVIFQGVVFEQTSTNQVDDFFTTLSLAGKSVLSKAITAPEPPHPGFGRSINEPSNRAV